MKYVALLIVAAVVMIWIATPSHPSSSNTSSVSVVSEPEHTLPPMAESKESDSSKPTALSAEEVKRLRDDRQYDLDLIDAVHAVLSAPSLNDAATAYCLFSAKQMEALERSENPGHENTQPRWYEQQNVGVCRGRVLMGVSPMPSPDKFREYEATARQDLTEVNQRLESAGLALETPEPTATVRWPNVSVLGFAAGESPHDAGTHVSALGLKHDTGCKSAEASAGYIECKFLGATGESMEVSFLHGQLQHFLYTFGVNRYEEILGRIEEHNGTPRAATDPHDSTREISKEWGSYNERFSISLEKTVDAKGEVNGAVASVIFHPSKSDAPQMTP